MERVYITSDGFVEFQKVEICKKMPLSDFTRELNLLIGGYDTPILPYGTISFLKKNIQNSTGTYIAFLTQPRIIRLNYKGVNYPYAVPYMLYFIKYEVASLIVYRYFVKSQVIKGNTVLYHSNLPNTYNNSKLCLGEMNLQEYNRDNLIDKISEIISKTETSYFNDDLYIINPNIVTNSEGFRYSNESSIKIWSSLTEESNDAFWTLDEDIGFKTADTYNKLWEEFTRENRS